MNRHRLALALAAAIAGAGAAAADDDTAARSTAPLAPQCQQTPCGAECWEIRVTYHRDGVQHQAVVGGTWGSFPGATCWADQVAVRGFWLEGEMQPTKVPPAALELLVIDVAVIRPGAGDQAAAGTREDR